MGKGRKPIPAEIRKLQGNPGRRPIPEAPKTAPVTGRFPAPAWMDTEAKKEWGNVIKEYSELELITKTDLQLLAAWCAAVSQFVTANKKMNKLEGSLDDLPLMQAYRISLNEARNAMLQLAARFGFSPVDRLKLALPKKDDNKNEITDFLKRKKNA